MKKNNKILRGRGLKTTTIPLLLSGHTFKDVPFLGKNYWVASYPQIFCGWRMTLNEKSEIRLEILRECFTLAQANYVLRSIPLPEPKDEKIINENKVTVLDSFLKTINVQIEDETTKLPDSIVSFYANSETIVELPRANLGEVLRQLNSKEDGKHKKKYMENVAPVTLYVLNHDLNASTKIDFVLHSDIWFPWVVGFNEEFPATSVEKMYDNRQLAMRHTRRLNTFLEETKAMCTARNVPWELVPEMIHPMYQHMVTDNGIILRQKQE